MATAATRKTPAKKVRFNPADLPATGTVQFRHGGDYKPAVRDLLAFAKGNDVAKAHVKALIHLGWVKPGGVNAESKSGACVTAAAADLPAACWTFDEPAAPQISANLQALAEAGAPAEALDALWGAYVGI
jgi:hypothetical protein